MRVAFITFEYPPNVVGGSGLYAKNLIQGLRARGHEIVVFTPCLGGNPEEQDDDLVRTRIKGTRFSAVKFWSGLPKDLKREHGKNPFDIVHVNGGSFLFLFGKIIPVPHVSTIHHLAYDPLNDRDWNYGDGLFGESGPLLRYLEKKYVTCSDHVISVSEYTKERAKLRYGIPEEGITAVLNGYEPSVVDDGGLVGLKERLGLDDRPILLFVGRIDDPRKNIGALLDAFSLLLKRMDAQLLVVGGGDSKDILSRVKTLGIEDNVTLAGFVSASELDVCYSMCDLHVCPSKMEGFGRTLLESLSHGKRTVANDAGAISEIAGPGCKLVNASDPECFSEAIFDSISEKLPQSEEIRKHLDYFNWDRTARETEAVYELVLGRDRRIDC